MKLNTSFEDWRPKYLPYVTIALVTSFLTANILAFKVVEIFGFTVGAAAIFFPISLIIGDILGEVYGFKRAKTAILIGMACYLYFVIVSQVTTILPPAPQWPMQKEYEAIFGFAPRVFIGGCLAYLGGELVNAYILTRMKIMQKGNHFAARAMVSTFAGELVHTSIFAPIVFWGVLPAEKILSLILTATLIKIIVEACILPFTILLISRLKAAEGIDFFDKK